MGPSNPESAPQPLAPLGHGDRWWQLQRLRRQGSDPGPLLEAIEAGRLAAEADLLAALFGVLDRGGVERLLAVTGGADPSSLVQAVQPELPALAGQERLRQAWLAPLLEQHRRACQETPDRADLWLLLLGMFRDPEVAARLRQALLGHPELAPPGGSCPASGNRPQRDQQAATPDQHPAPAATAEPARARGDGFERRPLPSIEELAPLLGLQRQSQDAALLLLLALRPGPLARRRAALEGLALGLSAWPRAELTAGLTRLCTDLDPGLASGAVDLLARLPEAGRPLRRLCRRALDPKVRARLRRRLPASPLVLLVHGRQGGRIPEDLEELAAELRRLRGAPVLLQALSSTAAPDPPPGFWPAARRTGALTLVPLLLLPGGHVRRDLPELAQAWRQAARAEADLMLWRVPFLGSWPAWQQRLRHELLFQAGDRQLCWLHHPLEGQVAGRFLQHLGELLQQAGQPVPFDGSGLDPARPPGPALLVPWTLAANRLSDGLAAAPPRPDQPVLPPFVQIDSLRQALLEQLSELA